MITSQEEFERKNARRTELINKEFHLFTDDERREFFHGPNWYEVFQKRAATDLTPEEEAELEQLQDEVGEYLDRLMHPEA